LTRPRSIRLFEAFFLTSFLLTLVATALIWPTLLAQAAAQAGAANLGDGTLAVIAGVGVAIVSAIMLLLWWFVARRGSGVAKWVLVLFTAYNLYSLIGSVQAGASVTTLPGLVSGAALLLQVVAVGLLFLPDARAWFAAKPEALS
jgi:hypothetical protein